MSPMMALPLTLIQLDNAAATVLVNIPKVQDDAVGDGTIRVCVRC